MLTGILTKKLTDCSIVLTEIATENSITDPSLNINSQMLTTWLIALTNKWLQQILLTSGQTENTVYRGEGPFGYPT